MSDRLLEARVRVTPYGAGLALRTPLVAGFPPAGEHLLNLEIGVTQGRVACLAIRSAHGEPLTGALLSSVPVAEIVTTVAATHSFRVFRTKCGRYIGVYYSDAFDSMPGYREDLDELRADEARPTATSKDSTDRVCTHCCTRFPSAGMQPGSAAQRASRRESLLTPRFR